MNGTDCCCLSDDVIAKNAKKIANRRQSKGNASTGSNNAKKAPAPSAKVAKSVGAAKAKRSAKVDQVYIYIFVLFTYSTLHL